MAGQTPMRTGDPQPTPGRPRKLTRRGIVDAALQVLEEEGFKALNMRALGLRLGVNHATIYNYFNHIEDIETQALKLLVASVSVPSPNSPVPMRVQLIEHLLTLRELQMQHPHVLHAPVGSTTWRSYSRLQNRVLRELKPYGASLSEVAAAYVTLTALMATSAERARRIGGDYVEIQRRAVWKLAEADSESLREMFTDKNPPRNDSLEELLNHLIDRLLPQIDQHKASK